MSGATWETDYDETVTRPAEHQQPAAQEHLEYIYEIRYQGYSLQQGWCSSQHVVQNVQSCFIVSILK